MRLKFLYKTWIHVTKLCVILNLLWYYFIYINFQTYIKLNSELQYHSGVLCNTQKPYKIICYAINDLHIKPYKSESICDTQNLTSKTVKY